MKHLTESRALSTIIPMACSFLIMIWILTIALVSGGDSFQVASLPDDPVYYIVQPGDSLWSIAAQYRPNENLAKVVDELMALNDCGPIIHPWDVLVVPVEAAK